MTRQSGFTPDQDYCMEDSGKRLQFNFTKSSKCYTDEEVVGFMYKSKALSSLMALRFLLIKKKKKSYQRKIKKLLKVTKVGELERLTNPCLTNR